MKMLFRVPRTHVSHQFIPEFHSHINFFAVTLVKVKKMEKVNYLENSWFSSQIKGIFGFLASKSFSVPIFRALSCLKQILQPKKGFLNIAILDANRDLAKFKKLAYFENRWEFTGSNFQD